jgi:hypothetical protein
MKPDTYSSNRELIDNAAAKTAHLLVGFPLSLIFMVMIAFLPAGIGGLLFLVLYKLWRFISWYFMFRLIVVSSRAGLRSADYWDMKKEKISNSLSPLLTLYLRNS